MGLQCSLTVQIGRLIWLAILDILNVEPLVGLEDGLKIEGLIDGFLTEGFRVGLRVEGVVALLQVKLVIIFIFL